MIQLKSLTKRGTSKLEKDLEVYKEMSYPEFNIDDYATTDPDEGLENITLDETKQFLNKLDAGKFFLKLFGGRNISDKIWNYIFLIYYKQVFREGGIIGKDISRVFLSPSNSYAPSSHCFKVPYRLCSIHKKHLDNINFLLQDPINTNKSVLLEVIKKPSVASNLNFIKVIKDLYIDRNSHFFGKDGGEYTYNGGIKRLMQLYNQYDRCFDMYHIEPEKFIEMLLSSNIKDFTKLDNDTDPASLLDRLNNAS